ncbi:inhibitor of growth protein 2 [Toxorhynchites rutilus septentrionalis]|uniref:inhibitor of growth protein 2 n=1 Tax=Toxorhynchites rutilus septentrionalis TaxID=329112 RepID=UPI0024786E3E|nr:inhibitor of growth protein 2 [Toxorhynchites rutilus septentrionalis]
MINHVTVEALHSANYVENYLDSVENLPDDVQRHLSRIREIDVLYRNHLRDVSVYYDQWNSANGSLGQLVNGSGAGSDSSAAAVEPSNASKRAMARMQQGLISAQELGDEKLQIVQHLQDLIDHKTRQLDQDFKNLGSDFFSRLDYGREEKVNDSQQKEIRSNSPVSACSSNNVNLSPAVYASAIGNGQSTAASGANGGNGSTANSASGGNYSANSVSSNTHIGSTSGAGASGGMGSGGGSERGSKRARRQTRNEQQQQQQHQHGGSANGSSTPNSISGAQQMDVDPIDTVNVKQEVGSASGSGQATSSGASGSGTGAGGKANSGQNNSASSGKKGGAGSGKKKKRKTGRGQARETREDTPPPEEAIDPDEPTYCLCDQISFGEMILCDNDLCPIEWFHFSCVALMSKPKGKWFCPNCRGDRPNVMKPKAQFLKELERYNKEKEEKT